jgi:hypothetical protein
MVLPSFPSLSTRLVLSLYLHFCPSQACRHELCVFTVCLAAWRPLLHLEPGVAQQALQQRSQPPRVSRVHSGRGDDGRGRAAHLNSPVNLWVHPFLCRAYIGVARREQAQPPACCHAWSPVRAAAVVCSLSPLSSFLHSFLYCTCTYVQLSVTLVLLYTHVHVLVLVILLHVVSCRKIDM